MRNIRKELQEGKHLIGTWLNSGSPILAELMAGCGFDFITVDVEHSAVDLPQTQRLFQAICSGRADCAPFVRLHGVDYSFVKRYLDAGARGIICPLINTPEDAKLLVDACKYPPMGNRGVGFCRGNQYGMNLQREVERANEEIMTAVQIEHIQAVDRIDEILAVPGIDAVFIGPYDLSASMGLTGQFEHPDYVAARDKILDSSRKNKVVAGIHVIQPNPEELLQRSREGYRLIAYSLDITMILSQCQESFEVFRKSGIVK